MPYPPVILELFKSLKTQLDDIERERVSNQYTLNHIFKEQQNAQNDEKSAEVSFNIANVIILTLIILTFLYVVDHKLQFVKK